MFEVAHDPDEFLDRLVEWLACDHGPVSKWVDIPELFAEAEEPLPEWAVGLGLYIEGEWHETYAQTLESPAEYAGEFFVSVERDDKVIWSATLNEDELLPDAPFPVAA